MVGILVDKDNGSRKHAVCFWMGGWKGREGLFSLNAKDFCGYLIRNPYL